MGAGDLGIKTEHSCGKEVRTDLREAWRRTFRLRTGVGRYRSSVKQWGPRTVQHVSVTSHNRQVFTS